MLKNFEKKAEINDKNSMGKELNFFDSPHDILKALLQSKEEGTSVGIKAHCLGQEVVTTAVEDIIFHDTHTVIVVKHYDGSGYILPSHKINLLEIQAVFPFNTPFVNPYLKSIDKDKSWFF
jgi:hypothetical protein